MTGRDKVVKFTVNAAFFREIKEDHHHLRQILHRLHELASHPPALENHPREFVSLLAELRDQLAFHFALEEAYGYFEDAVNREPRLHAEAGKLRDQHAELYLVAQQLADTTAMDAASGALDIQSVSERFLDFDTLLKSHESAELSLILEAINQDIGGGD
jgi:hypothetical protein